MDTANAGAPMGGTERLRSFLAHVLRALTTRVQVICSRPEQTVLGQARPRLLWLHDRSHDQNVHLHVHVGAHVYSSLRLYGWHEAGRRLESVCAEASCLAAQEALMAGCLGITSACLGGRFSRRAEAWPWMFGFDESPEVMCLLTQQRAMGQYRHPNTQAQLVAQSEYFQRCWSFESRVPEWDALLTRLAVEKPRTRLSAEP